MWTTFMNQLKKLIGTILFRFQFRGQMKLPTLQDRSTIIEKNLKKEFGLCRLNKKDLKRLGKHTKGYNSRDLVHVLGLAILKAFQIDVQSNQFSVLVDEEGNELFTAAKATEKGKGNLLSFEAQQLPDNSLRGRDLSYDAIKKAFKSNRRRKNTPGRRAMKRFDKKWKQLPM